MTFVLAIDQGTTSSRAVVFDANMQVVASAQQEFAQHFKHSGWVEHDPSDILDTVLATCRDALVKAQISASDLASIGITNQRETTVVWDKSTGIPVYNAIVWQDRRTATMCDGLRAHETEISAKTGLLLDPYFSGTKVRWILDQIDGHTRAANGDLLFGTIDSFLIWHLTNGKHVTDATNASRTMLYDIHKGEWSEDLCALIGVPMQMLPEVLDCAAEFGVIDAAHLGAAVPIRGVAGDQQAAAIGQACFTSGMLKSTYGTGCFALLNTGTTPVASQNRLLTTVASQIEGKRSYALEGSIFVAGAVVQWLRDGLHLIDTAGETEQLAQAAQDRLTIVPAFTGLGAPYWNAECRGAIYGLTRASGPADFARAALESIGFQTRDMLEAMQADWGASSAVLRVDGGLSANNWAMQFLADISDVPVERPANVETTSLGAAWLAGMQSGVYPDAAGFAEMWGSEHCFEPKMPADQRETLYAGWGRAVRATLSV